MNKSFRPSESRNNTTDQPQTSIPASQNQNPKKSKPKFATDKWFNVANITLLATITVLIVAVAIFLGTTKDPNSKEFSKVDETKLQAVFLNNGQVYFGKITGLDDRTMTLSSIYYLRSNQQDSANQQDISNTLNADDLSLVKLGCEVHGPEDQMVITRDQIVFWENLKNDGKVASTVKQYVKDNPNGKDCATQEQQSSTQNNQSTQNQQSQPSGQSNSQSQPNQTQDSSSTNGNAQQTDQSSTPANTGTGNQQTTTP